MGLRGLDIARLIFEAEPDAMAGDPAAVERTTEVLAKIIGAFLTNTLVRHGDEALSDAVERVAKTVELEARETAATLRHFNGAEADEPPDTIN